MFLNALFEADCVTGLAEPGFGDSDGDGVPDVSDGAPNDPMACGDSDADSCDDCASGHFDLAYECDSSGGGSGGCCDAGRRAPGGPLALGGLVLAALPRRRRRPARASQRASRLLRLLGAALLVAALPACGFDSPGSGDDEPSGPASCTSETMLRTSSEDGATVTECAWGCLSDDSPRCATFTPAAGVATSADLQAPGLADLVLDNATIDTDDGEIPGRRDKGIDVKEGIDFQVRSTTASVLRVKSLRVTGNVKLRGDHAIAIVAEGTITIEGIIDGRGDPICAPRVAGPGGSDGGAAKLTAPGMGAGAGTLAGDSGGGGGGHGAAGGNGGGTVGAAGGMAFGTTAITELIGGGGGGGGGSGNNSGTGGGGGAAIQLVSNKSITIAMTGGINAGGCGGGKGSGGNDGGGGGGAGGMILLEAPTITIAGSSPSTAAAAAPMAATSPRQRASARTRPSMECQRPVAPPRTRTKAWAVSAAPAPCSPAARRSPARSAPAAGPWAACASTRGPARSPSRRPPS
jgi:hypothetical protein